MITKQGHLFKSDFVGFLADVRNCYWREKLEFFWDNSAVGSCRGVAIPKDLPDRDMGTLEVDLLERLEARVPGFKKAWKPAGYFEIISSDNKEVTVAHPETESGVEARVIALVEVIDKVGFKGKIKKGQE